MIDTALLYESSLTWAQGFPRRSTFGEGANQTAVDNRSQIVSNLKQAAASMGPGYYSVYAFPDGHSGDGNVPAIDTLFFDLDIPKNEGEYDPSSGGSRKAWQRDMSKLLVRARMISRAILEQDQAQHFRVAYSGHKGIHLYIDFSELPKNLGPLQQYKNGIASYADGLIDHLEQTANVDLHNWVDVTSHDLGRLARHPNTPHHGAEHVSWTPYCVPGSIEELATLDPEGYLELTRSPRPPLNDGRVESDQAHEVLVENIKRASASSTRSTPGTSKHRDDQKLAEYRDTSNDAIGVETVRELLIQGKPCIKAWIERDDAYDHGQASRTMEINVIKELASHDVPIDVMVEFFSTIPRFDEDYTRELIKDIIARYYPSSFVCRNICDDAPQFCLGDDCAIYNRSEDLTIQ